MAKPSQAGAEPGLGLGPLTPSSRLRSLRRVWHLSSQAFEKASHGQPGRHAACLPPNSFPLCSHPQAHSIL